MMSAENVENRTPFVQSKDQLCYVPKEAENNAVK